jgi:hypothetical protein
VTFFWYATRKLNFEHTTLTFDVEVGIMECRLRSISSLRQRIWIEQRGEGRLQYEAYWVDSRDFAYLIVRQK